MIGSEIIGPTSLGTSTTKTQLGGADLVLPSWAKAILAIRPFLQIETPTTDEAVMAYVTLESDDFAVQPYQVLCNPILPIDGTPGNPLAGEPPWYPLNCPINGGDRLKAYGTALAANTAAPHMSLQLILSDKKPSGQMHAKIGTLTSTGTTANINVDEAAYTLTGGSMLKEILGFVAMQTMAPTDMIMGRFEFLSNDFRDPTPLKLPTNPMCGILGASAILTPGLSRAKVEVPILSPCQLTNNLNMAVAPANAGKFITGVLFT